MHLRQCVHTQMTRSFSRDLSWERRTWPCLSTWSFSRDLSWERRTCPCLSTWSFSRDLSWDETHEAMHLRQNALTTVMIKFSHDGQERNGLRKCLNDARHQAPFLTTENLLLNFATKRIVKCLPLLYTIDFAHSCHERWWIIQPE